MILIPKRREIAVQSEARVGVAGFFKMEAIRPDGRRRTLVDWFPNLILNTGLDNIGNGSESGSTEIQWMGYCRVGTGSATPVVGDIAMNIHKAEVGPYGGSTAGATAAAPYYRWLRRTYRFAAGAAQGNLTEVGIGFRIAEGNLSARSLIKDGAGNPTTVTVLADEVLDVTYEVRAHIPDTSDRVGTIVLDGDTFDTITRPSLIDQAKASMFYRGNTYELFYYSGALGAIDENPFNAIDSQFTSVEPAYSNGNYYNDNIFTAGITKAENAGAGGIKCVRALGRFGDWQTSFVSQTTGVGIPHDNTNELILTMRQSWARYTPP